jgi:DNA polymerase III subunit chi
MAPRVDFYVLEGAEDRARLVYACRVIEKAFLQQLSVCVNLGTPAEAASFDTLLWTFADRAFVPHALTHDGTGTAGAPPQTPVWVGCLAPIAADLLVNLAPVVPGFFGDYARVAEFVDAEPARRDAGRRRFAFYRERGLAPDTHKLAG